MIGFGLIGSSLARVVRREGLARHIAACARTGGTLAKARELGLADSYTTDPAAAVEGDDGEAAVEGAKAAPPWVRPLQTSHWDLTRKTPTR